jgi:hypothetical protein
LIDLATNPGIAFWARPHRADDVDSTRFGAVRAGVRARGIITQTGQKAIAALELVASISTASLMIAMDVYFVGEENLPGTLVRKKHPDRPLSIQWDDLK